ncbi:MAG: type II toxin-antitoxin system Phd/YefM family antitoxin [Gemmataceae bacterium]
MLDIANDILSLSDFKRNSHELMKRIKATGNPVVLTVNGKAEVVVQDATSYQRLLDLASKAEMVEFLLESKRDVDAGRTVNAEGFLESLGKRKKRARKS